MSAPKAEAMKLLILSVISSVLLSASGQSTINLPPSGQFNDAFDRIIETYKDQEKVLKNETLIADQKAKAESKVGLLTFSYEFGFQNITLFGMDTLRRIGDADRFETRYGNTELRAGIALGPLKLRFTTVTKVLGIGPKLPYEAELTDVSAAAVLHFHPKNERIYVKSFTLREFTGLRFYARGPGIVTPFLTNQIFRVATATLTPVVKLAIQQNGERFLQSIVAENDFIKRIIKLNGGRP